MHWAEGFVRLCPLVWDMFHQTHGAFANRVAGILGLAIVIFHELCHRSGLVPLLKDVTDHGDQGGPIGSRKLVLDGHLDDAFQNIDNYVHWAFARFAWFGGCTMFDPSIPWWSCSGGGDNFGDDVTICCKRCGAIGGGVWGDCEEQ